MTAGNDPKPEPRNPIGAGAPLAFLLIGGVVIGGIMGQPTIGLLTGLALGIGVAVLVWRLRK